MNNCYNINSIYYVHTYKNVNKCLLKKLRYAKRKAKISLKARFLKKQK